MKSPRRPTSFVQALISNVAGLVVALGAALLVALIWQSLASTEEAARQEISETLDRATERLRILVRAAEMTAESAERASLAPKVTGATLRSTLEASLAAFEQRPELSYLGIVIPETGEYGNLERTANGQVLLWLFPGTRTEDPMRRNFLLTDKGFVLHEERPADGYDPRKRPFYLAAVNGPAGGTWMPAYQWIVHSGATEPLWGFSYVKALRDETGRLVCVLDTDFDVPALNHFLKSLAAENRCQIQLVELSQPPRWIGGPTIGQAPLPLPRDLAPLATSSNAAFVDRMKLDGERQWVAARRLELKGAGVSWLVVVSRKDPLIQAALRRQLYPVIGVGLALAAGLVLVSVRMARRFGQPLAELEQRVASIEHGGPDAPAATAAGSLTGGFRETQHLGEAFDRMAAAIRQREHELSAQNSRLLEAKEQREASLALKAAIYDSTITAIFSVDPQMAVIEWNIAAERLFGAPRERVLGQNVTGLVLAPEGPADWEALLKTTGIAAFRFTGAHGAFDAEVRLLTVSQDGREIRTFFVNDVSERKNAELRLRRQRDYANAIINTLPGVFYHYDENLRLLRWNRNLERITGYSPEELTGADPMIFFIEAEKALVTQRIAEVFEKGESSVETDYLLKDGRRIPYLFTGARFEYDGRQHLIGVGTDISEQKQMEHALRESLARFRAAARASGDVIWDWDLTTNEIWWNDNFQNLFGHPPDEVEPTIESWTRRLHPDDLDRVAAHIHAIIDGTEETWVDEYRFLRKDGSYADVFDRGHVLRDASGRGVRMVGAIQDITERKQAQARLLAFNAELEQRVAHRTQELQTLNREMETFCYSVSHDLRAPLRGIAGFAEILVKNYAGDLDDTAKNYLARVLTATHRMGELIDDLLKLSRVSREEMHRETVNLSAIAREILADLQHAAPERVVEVAVEDGLSAEGDPRLLRVLLENLLGNAWKFTSKTPDARISFTAAGGEGGTRTFAVSDNGAGFDMRYAGKLFGAFQRLHRVTEFPGTGIGLATVQRIVNRHGGCISAHAEPQKGATFRFSF